MSPLPAVALLRRIPIVRLVTLLLVLSACGGGESKPADTATPATTVADVGNTADKGAATYGQICASCHQASGEGVEGNFPPLKGSTWLNGNAEVPVAIVLAGLQGEIVVNGKTYAGAMQGWGMLSDDDVANVLTYARSQWGNTAGPVTAAQVKAVRDKIGSRSAWTAAELKATYPGAGN